MTKLLCIATVLAWLLAGCGQSATSVPSTSSAFSPTAVITLAPDTPGNVARIFVGALQSAEPGTIDDDFISTYFTGYFADLEFQKGMAGTFANANLTFHEPIEIDGSNAIVKVDVLQGENQISIVVFLKKGPTWKVDALRSLALPGYTYQLRELLRAKSNLSPEEQWQLRDTNRLFATDEELLAAFEQNEALFIETGERFYSQDQVTVFCRPAFDQCRINGESVPIDELDDALAELGIDKSAFDLYAQALDRLDLSCIERGLESNIQFLKGGILDNSLGYIYAPDDNVPKITKREYFYIERIKEHWYIFRTT